MLAIGINQNQISPIAFSYISSVHDPISIRNSMTGFFYDGFNGYVFLTAQFKQCE